MLTPFQISFILLCLFTLTNGEEEVRKGVWIKLPDTYNASASSDWSSFKIIKTRSNPKNIFKKLVSLYYSFSFNIQKRLKIQHRIFHQLKSIKKHV